MNPEATSVEASHEPQAQSRALPLATGYRVLDPAKEYPIKSPCPYCGGKLVLSGINGAEQDDDGTWIATDLDINCTTEPDIDGPEWEGWWQDHSAHDFCQAWHDLHERLVRNLRRHCRVSYDNTKLTDAPNKGPSPER